MNNFSIITNNLIKNYYFFIQAFYREISNYIDMCQNYNKLRN